MKSNDFYVCVIFTCDFSGRPDRCPAFTFFPFIRRLRGKLLRFSDSLFQKRGELPGIFFYRFSSERRRTVHRYGFSVYETFFHRQITGVFQFFAVGGEVTVGRMYRIAQHGKFDFFTAEQYGHNRQTQTGRQLLVEQAVVEKIDLAISTGHRQTSFSA